MSWRKTYTGYSIGCAIVWAVVVGVVAGILPNRLHTFRLIGAGWWIGWTSATIARSVYPPPKLKLPPRRQWLARQPEHNSPALGQKAGSGFKSTDAARFASGASGA